MDAIASSVFDLSTLSDPLFGFSPPDQELLRRCASVRVCDEPVFHQVMRVGLGDAMELNDLAKLYFVERLPGPGYRYRLRGSTRTEIFDTWWRGDARLSADAPVAVPARLRALSERLVDYYRAEGDDLERLYHLALVDEAKAIQMLNALFDEADQQFDLAQCSAILRTLEERSARELGADLRQALLLKRVRMDTRSMWAPEYRETISYVERNETQDLLDRLLADPQRWILNIHAPGGMGKSIFIRAVIARRCVKENIPCAKIDFDFVPYMVNVAREPWRLLLGIAQQLTRQLLHNPFQELLTQYASYAAEADSRPIISPREYAGADLSDDEKAMLRADVLSRFTGTLQEIQSSFVLFFDTLENLLHSDVDLQELFDLLEYVHTRCSQVRVIMSGRLDLSQPIPRPDGGLDDEHETEFARRFAGQNIPMQLRGFDETEAHAYLETKRGMIATDPRVPVMIEKARIQGGDHGREGISPFKLALLADIVSVHSKITADEFDRYEDVDLAHLVERVVDRIQDDRVKWLVRYGIVPRLLTRAAVAGVLIPFMVAGMKGQAEHDDASQDPAVEPQLDRSPFPQVGEGLLEVDTDVLWDTLYRYTAEYSWVFVDEAAGALRFHPDVIEPVRRLLRKHQQAGRPILLDLHRACAAYYEDQVGTNPGNRAKWLRESVYHKLQSEDPDADGYWLQWLDKAAGDAETVRALANEALHEPRTYDEAGQPVRADMPRFGDGVRARAYFELANGIVQGHAVLRERDWDEVDQHVAQAERLNAASGGLIPAARLDYLLARSALARNRRQQALQMCQQALESPADVLNELDLRILYAEILRSLDRPGASEQYTRAAELARTSGRERLDDINRAWIGALGAEERFEEAAEVCARWRAGMDANAAADLIGESLLTHMRQYLAMGQEQRAAAVAQAGLDSWLAASTGRLGGLGNWPARLRAEIMLAQQQPALALRELGRESGPARKGRSVRARQSFETELRARIYAALIDALGVTPEMKAMVFTVHGPRTKQGIRWTLEYSRFNVDETGNLGEAKEYLDTAQGNAEDPESEARCDLMRARLLARQGKSDEAREAARELAARSDLPSLPSLRLLAALEVAIQGGGPEAWQALLDALEPVKPATRRLFLLAELRRCPKPEALPSEIRSALLALLPDAYADGQDAALGALRLAEVQRVVGRVDQARRLLQQAAEGSGDPLRWVVLRQVYLAYDRLGWDPAALRAVTMDDLLDPAWDGSHELGGLILLEHAERLVGVLGDPDRATERLDRAETLLKSSTTVWSARVAALRARIANLQGDLDRVQDYLERATKSFDALGDKTSVEALRQSLSTAETFGTAGALSSSDQCPRLDVQLSLKDRDWHIELQRSDGPNWVGDVPLSDDFGSLVDDGNQEAISRQFVEEFQRDSGRVALQMGRHLFPVPARGLVSGSDRPLDLRLDVQTMALGWLPWELLRLDEDSLPLSIDDGCRWFYRHIKRTGVPERGESPASVLIVRMAKAGDVIGTRALDMTGVELQFTYREAGLGVKDLEQPEPWKLERALEEVRPAVVHIVSNLVESGHQAELVFGGRGGTFGMEMEQVSQSDYGSEVPYTLSVSRLGTMMAVLEPPPLVVLDVPAPPVTTERLRQLILRNAFAAEWATYTPPAAILATGLGDAQERHQLVKLLVRLLHEERAIGDIASEIRALAKQVGSIDRGEPSSPMPGVSSLVSFVGTALFTDRPEQVFRLR